MPKWRNRQTHVTQNHAGYARGGSTPPFGTKNISFNQTRCVRVFFFDIRYQGLHGKL